MIESSSKIALKYSKTSCGLQTSFRKMVGNVSKICMSVGESSEYFQKIFRNLWKMLGNLRKLLKSP